MTNVLCFAFLLTFALVLSHQDVQKRATSVLGPQQITQESTTKALVQLEKEGVRIFEMWSPFYGFRQENFGPPVSKACKKDMEKNKIGDKETGFRFAIVFQKTCYLIGYSNLIVSMKSKTEQDVPSGSDQCANLPAFQAVFLPYDVDTNTYMILNPDLAPWFFTSELSGCDIFVATAENQGNRPMVVHSNLNKCKKNLMNLRSKGESVDQLLNSHLGYQLIARVYHEPLAEEKIEANQYLAAYKINHQGISLISYNMEHSATPQLYHFFAHYDIKWNFILKGEENGDTTTFKVSALGKVVAN